MRLALVPLVLSGCFLSACGSIPVSQLEAFGEQSTELSSNVSEVVEEIYQARLNKQIELAITEGGVINTLDSLQLFDRHLFKTSKDQTVADLMSGSEVLGKYFNALHALALVGDSREFTLSAAELSEAVFSLNDAHDALGGSNEFVSKESAALIGKVAGLMSNLYARNRAAEGIRDIVLASDDAVQSVASLMAESLQSVAVSNVLYGYREEHLVANLIDYMDAEPSQTMAQRRAALGLIVDEYRQLRSSSKAVENAVSALQALAKAHNELAKSLAQSRYSGKNILAAIKQLKQQVDDFNDTETLFIECESNRLVLDDNSELACKE